MIQGIFSSSSLSNSAGPVSSSQNFFFPFTTRHRASIAFSYRKREPRFFLNFPRSSIGKKRENRTMHRFATGRRRESVERGRPIRMEHVRELADRVLSPVHARADASFCRCPGWNERWRGRGGTGNPGLTYFQPMDGGQMVESRDRCKHRLNGDQRRKRHKRPALSPWTVIFLAGRETSVRPFEQL